MQRSGGVIEQFSKAVVHYALTLICQDITKMKVKAIVNAANTGLQMGGGVCGAIFRRPGR